MPKHYLVPIVLIAAVSVVAACAGPNTAANTVAGDGTIAGFWWGLLHGCLAPITFFISLFKDNVSMYEVHNTGGWYDFGFVIGAGILFGGGGKASSRN